jgi:hypothetical protein
MAGVEEPGIDVLAAPDDHVLHPSHNLAVAVGMNHGNIPANSQLGVRTELLT